MTMAQCFKRQQKCRDLLKSADAPLSDANLIWAGRRHFERVPFLQRACRKWREACPPTVTPTWTDFKRHFQLHCNEHINEQATLSNIGIVNSALDKAHATIVTKNTQLEEALAQHALTLAHNDTLMALLAEQKQCPTVPTMVETNTKTNSTSELTDRGPNLEVAALSQQSETQNNRSLNSQQPCQPINQPRTDQPTKRNGFLPKATEKKDGTPPTTAAGPMDLMLETNTPAPPAKTQHKDTKTKLPHPTKWVAAPPPPTWQPTDGVGGSTGRMKQ